MWQIELVRLAIADLKAAVLGCGQLESKGWLLKVDGSRIGS